MSWPATRIVPIRGTFPFAVTLNATTPLPEPVPPAVIVMNGQVVMAVHAHPAAVVTVRVADDAVAGRFTPVGEIVYMHGPAACVSVNVCPETINEPVRCEPGFAATLYVRVAFPLPVVGVGNANVSHGWLMLPAVHAQSWRGDTMTSNVPVDAVFGAVALDGESEYVHGGMGAACVTVTIWPAIVSVPVRCAPTFEKMSNATIADPEPLALEGRITTNGALLVAVHVHPAAVVRFTNPAAALSSKLNVVGEIE